MKQHVMLLSAFLIILIINSGCTRTIFEECVTPDVKKPEIDNSRKANILEASKQCGKNYLAMRVYARQLEEANEVCK